MTQSVSFHRGLSPTPARHHTRAFLIQLEGVQQRLQQGLAVDHFHGDGRRVGRTRRQPAVVEIGPGVGVARDARRRATRPAARRADAARPRQRDPHELGGELSDKRRAESIRLFASSSRTRRRRISPETAEKDVRYIAKARRRKKTKKRTKNDAQHRPTSRLWRAWTGTPRRPGGAGVDPRGRIVAADVLYDPTDVPLFEPGRRRLALLAPKKKKKRSPRRVVGRRESGFENL